MPGEFTLGETTLGDTLAAVAGPPIGSDLGASALIDRQNVKARWGERYTSDAVNKKFVGFPRGVYYGLIPVANGLELSLKPDVSVSFTNIVGLPTIGEVITGSLSGAMANIRVISPGIFLIDALVDEFQIGETITGADSGFTSEVTRTASDGISFARVSSNTPSVFGRTEHMLDIITTDTTVIDFTGFVDGTYYVFATGSYSVGSTTIATVQSRTTPPPNQTTEVLVCVVTKVSSALTIEATSPTTRQEPYAGTGQRVGFMSGGSIESLLAATSTTQEVIAARESVDGTVAMPFDLGMSQTTGLPQRLREDLSRESMASRLGKKLIAARGNDYSVASPITEPLNISGSFSARTRDHQPFRDVTNTDLPTGVPVPIALEPDGSDNISLTLSGVSGSFGTGEVLIGAISDARGIIRSSSSGLLEVNELVGVFQVGETVDSAGPPIGSGTIDSIDNREGAITATDGGAGGDPIRNYVSVVDTFTGRKPVDAFGDPIYGRLLFGPNGASSPSGGDPGELVVASGPSEQLNFVQGSLTVTNNLINFNNWFLPGDLIEGDDGRYYEIDPTPGSVTSVALTLTAGKPYLGTSASSGLGVGAGPRRRRRFLLKFVSKSLGIETERTITPGTTIPSGAGIRVFIPCWLNGAQSNYAADLDMRGPGDAYAIAGEDIPGVGYNAPGLGGGSGTGSPVIGAVRTINLGVDAIGDGNFHTINYALGSVLSSPSAGVLNIISAGPTGPPGVGGSATLGPTGPTGQGYSVIYPYQSQDEPINVIGAANPWSVVFVFPGVVRFYMVNLSLKNSEGDLDTGYITDVTHVPGSNTITVIGEFDGGGGSTTQVMVIGAAAAG